MLRSNPRLRKDQLQFLSASLSQLRVGFRTHTYPLDTLRCGDRSVGFKSNCEPACMNCFDHVVIKLKQRFSSGEHHKPPLRSGAPGRCNTVRQFLPRSRSALPPPRLFPRSPCRKTGRWRWNGQPRARSKGCSLQNGRTRRRGRPAPFALQRLEDFFDCVSQQNSAVIRVAVLRVGHYAAQASMAARVGSVGNRAGAPEGP